MNKKRQDSWSSDEDTILAEIVLRYIRQGKTQLEAFKQASKQLSRTPAACGYRWNARLRKQYTTTITQAKNNKGEEKKRVVESDVTNKDHQSLEQAISLIKKFKSNSDKQSLQDKERFELIQLRKENEQLTARLKNYEAAFTEIYNIWNWLKNKNEH